MAKESFKCLVQNAWSLFLIACILFLIYVTIMISFLHMIRQLHFFLEIRLRFEELKKSYKAKPNNILHIFIFSACLLQPLATNMLLASTLKFYSKDT